MQNVSSFWDANSDNIGTNRCCLIKQNNLKLIFHFINHNHSKTHQEHYLDQHFFFKITISQRADTVNKHEISFGKLRKTQWLGKILQMTYINHSHFLRSTIFIHVKATNI
jgi:hypothetical protein